MSQSIAMFPGRLFIGLSFPIYQYKSVFKQFEILIYINFILGLFETMPHVNPDF